MKQLMKSFLSLSLLFVAAAGSLQASSCNTSCNDSCSTGCSTSCNDSCSIGCNDSCGSNNCSNSCDSICGSTSSCGSCHSVYIPRSAFSNTAYFWLPFPSEAPCDEWYGTAELGFEFQRSFRGCELAKCLFGRSTLNFQGSRVGGRSATSLIADNFGLSQNCDTSVRFNPRIENFNLHFQSRLGMDCWLDGLYGQLNFTFSHQKRTLFADENCGCDLSAASTGCNTVFPAGYMAATAVTPAATVKEALKGDFTFGNMTTPWKFGRFVFCDQTKNKVAGVSLILGWNFWKNDCGHFGLFFQYTAPTGNRPDARNVFSPVVGNGHHHEVGGGLTSHYELWKDDACDRNVTAYLDGYVLTLLKDCQVRSFDFKNRGCLSRYMLLKELTPTTTAAGFTYAGNLINAINFNTRSANVKVNVKGDASLRFIYHDGGFDFALGYNIYGQSKESICNISAGSPCNAVDTNLHYGLKGCTGVDCFTYATTGAGAAQIIAAGATATVSPLNATANATITSCDSVNNPVSTLTASSVCVSAFNTAPIVAGTTLVSTLVAATTSAPAVEVTTADLDLNSGKAPRQLTNKGFATLNYTWKDCDWSPYLGFGAEVEGGSRNCDLKQWGVWIKGGVSF